MPWMAFKKGDPHVLALKNKYKIKSVPSLIVLDAETGRTISTRERMSRTSRHGNSGSRKEKREYLFQIMMVFQSVLQQLKKQN